VPRLDDIAVQWKGQQKKISGVRVLSVTLTMALENDEFGKASQQNLPSQYKDEKTKAQRTERAFLHFYRLDSNSWKI